MENATPKVLLNTHGGARSRKKIGRSKPVYLTLSEEQWKEIEEAIDKKKVGSLAEYIRNAVTGYQKNKK